MQLTILSPLLEIVAHVLSFHCFAFSFILYYIFFNRMGKILFGFGYYLSHLQYNIWKEFLDLQGVNHSFKIIICHCVAKLSGLLDFLNALPCKMKGKLCYTDGHNSKEIGIKASSFDVCLCPDYTVSWAGQAEKDIKGIMLYDWNGTSIRS